MRDFVPVHTRIEHKMTEIERQQIQANVLEIADRVDKYGRKNERVRVKLDVLLSDQAAINYKVIKLFASDITDAELINLLLRLGVQNGTEIIKVIAPKNGIQI